MVISHNLPAMFTERQLKIDTKKKAKSQEKLSSGYKINRGADDAAGLSISEKMRRQIRGLDRGADNIMDGVSLCQVADGALSETQDILQRMNELCIQSANGTNSKEDRLDINHEISQLKVELDRIANTTTFNEHIKPLKDGSWESEDFEIRRFPGGAVLYDDIKMPEFGDTETMLKSGPFNDSTPLNEFNLKAVIKKSDIPELNGKEYNLLFNNNSTGDPSLAYSFFDDDGNRHFGKVSYNEMSKVGNVEVDVDNQTWTRKFSYTDPTSSDVSFTVTQKVTLENDNKAYRIDTSLNNDGTRSLKMYAFLQNFDTAYGYGSLNGGDKNDEYYVNGSLVDKERMWGNLGSYQLITNLCQGTSEDIVNENVLQWRHRQNRIPTSFSIASISEPTLPFSEKIEFLDGNRWAIFAVGRWDGTDLWGFIGKDRSVPDKDLMDSSGRSIDTAFTYMAAGDSSIRYGIEDIYTDPNLPTAREIELADFEISGIVTNKHLGNDVDIQCSAESNDKTRINLCNTTTKALGLLEADASTPENALKTVDLVSNALSKVNEYRSRFGAQQNRLEAAHAINKNTEENTTAGESRIRDTDIADEIVSYSAHSIIEQSAQSMLVQANQSTNQAVQLLQ